jgi:alpha-ketoglutarate-dependent taurine dioxygenase
MADSPLEEPRQNKLVIDQGELVEAGYLQPSKILPLVLQPTVEGVNLVAWGSSCLGFIEAKLLQHGGILFRNFNVNSAVEFEQFIRVISRELLEYSYRSTPRSHVSGHIYTSTEYPADQSIPLHHEMAYCPNWPMKIWFFCVQSAASGGETPIAESRRVFKRIAPKIRERFIQKKVMYVRNYGTGLDLPWQNVFQTTSKAAVENYCRRAGIEFKWTDSDRLKTWQVCQAVAAHPKTGETVWFNQAHLFHISSLPIAAREALLGMCKEEDLPRNAFYGDGVPIEASVLDEIRDAYQQEAVIFPWQKGDILMLDNMLAAHGRTPFVGPRRILVGMAETFTNDSVR